MNHNPIHVTPSAQSHLLQLVAKNQGIGFRLSIKKSGCSGHRYHPEIIHEASEQDLLFETLQGLKVFIQKQDLIALEGLVIDYVTYGAGQAMLEYSNPNAINACGCGESFALAPKNSDAVGESFSRETDAEI